LSFRSDMDRFPFLSLEGLNQSLKRKKVESIL
jgi:hypothetical protein